MQKNYFLKALFTIILGGLLSTSFAADWYISSTGNDETGDGSASLPWASFAKAQTSAVANDVIYVSGLIDFSLNPSIVLPVGVAIAKNLTIQGTSNVTDGFDGKGLTRFFSNSTFSLTLKNLKLVNGYSGNNNGGAIINTGSTGSLTCENLIFDSNKTGLNTTFPAANKTGSAIHFDNATGSTFKNCLFLNNEASKAGAIYFTSWAGNVLFENCAFVGNVAKESFGGSALFIRTIATGSPAMNIVNCTFKGNHVNTTSNGGTINFGGRATNTTTVNIINSTISENTTAGSSANSAGIFMNNSDANLDGIFYIKNSIIEGNKNATGAPADLNISAISATSPGGTTGYMAIQNSIIGFVATPANIPAGNITASAHFNYLTSTSTTNDLKAGLAPFNTTTNSFSLYTSSAAIGYGNSSYLTGLTPTVTTDQLGNVRTVGATNYAGSVETTPLATTTPSAPTSIVATAGTGQISVAFKSGATGGSLITNYKYSLDGGTTFTACSPVDILTPIVITGVSNQAYTVILKAVNDNGDGIASAASNSVTPVTVPEAPTALVAASGNTQITISFTEGANGGSAITNYKYSIDGGATFTACDPAQTTGPIVITGLTNGTSYTVILKAVNQYGDGIASAESNSVVPSTSTALESTLNQAVTIYKNAENQVIINNSTQKAGSVSLVNAIGQHMLTRRINNNITMINQTVQPGVYMVIVNVDGNIFKNKIIL
jgi:hypothetical protein